MIKIEDDVLVYDLECRTFSSKANPNKDRLKIFGCYSYKTKKTYMLRKKEDIEKILKAHKFLVGFNNEWYDNPILIREGYDIKYKIIIDLRKIFYNRAGVMKIKKGMLKDILMKYSLDYITRMLDLVDDKTAKGDIDYSVFRKEHWSDSETKEILEYAKRDIEITKKLYEWVEAYFADFKSFINEEDARKKYYLTTSIAKFSYKAICKAMKWPERYASDGDGTIQGGYVAYPAGEKFEGDMYCLDFNSLYPSAMIQANLYGRRKGLEDRDFWTGGNTWKVEGNYYSDKMSLVGKLFNNWYFMRLFFKRKFYDVEKEEVHSFKDIEKFKGKKIYVNNHVDWKGDILQIEVTDKVISEYIKLYKQGIDRREYSVKIILNTSYGVMNNPYYTNVYDITAGGDCTRLCRQWIKYARKVFRESGYENIYSDTDSCYVIDKFKDKNKMLNVKDKIIDDIKKTVPFPLMWFDLGIDDEIKAMFFFKGGKRPPKETDSEMDEDDFINRGKGFLKKNYIYITQDDRIVMKNLGIRKKSNSQLSRTIFWDYLVPEIIKTKEVKFSKVKIKNIIDELLNKDISLISVRREVNDPDEYPSKTSIQYQIAEKYGGGIHFLMPNVCGLGVGKGKKFCTIDEFKERKLGINDIDLSGIWSELSYFIKPVVTKNIFDFVKK